MLIPFTTLYILFPPVVPESAIVFPARRIRCPPTPVLPSPTLNVILPPLPPVDLPVVNAIVPEFPHR